MAHTVDLTCYPFAAISTSAHVNRSRGCSPTPTKCHSSYIIHGLTFTALIFTVLIVRNQLPKVLTREEADAMEFGFSGQEAWNHLLTIANEPHAFNAQVCVCV